MINGSLHESHGYSSLTSVIGRELVIVKSPANILCDAFGVMFELPLILLFLAKIGIATPEFLRQKRRHAIVIISIVSAVITPPDVISMIVMAVPLLVLYELGVFAVGITSRREK